MLLTSQEDLPHHNEEFEKIVEEVRCLLKNKRAMSIIEPPQAGNNLLDDGNSYLTYEDSFVGVFTFHWSNTRKPELDDIVAFLREQEGVYYKVDVSETYESSCTHYALSILIRSLPVEVIKREGNLFYHRV